MVTTKEKNDDEITTIVWIKKNRKNTIRLGKNKLLNVIRVKIKPTNTIYDVEKKVRF